MNIVHLCLACPYNDYWGYQDNLLPLYHQKAGHTTTVITTNTMHDKSGKIISTKIGEYVLNNGVRIIRKEHDPVITKKIGRILCYSNIYDDLCRFMPDFIMIHGLVSIVASQAIKYGKEKNPNCKIIADNHLDSIIHNTSNYKSRLITAYFKFRNKFWQKQYKKVFGVTPWRTQYAHEVFGISKDKLDTLVMGADDEKIDYDNKEMIRKEIRKKHNISNEDFLFVTGGKLENNKCIIETIEAFSKIKSDKVKLLIFGNATQEIEIGLKSVLGKDERILYIGFISADEIYKYFLASDLGVFPGRHSVVWEQAVACGLSCIFKKYVEEGYVDVGGNCILLETERVEDIYNAMLRVCNNIEIFERMKSIACNKARFEFLYSNIAVKCLNV